MIQVDYTQARHLIKEAFKALITQGCFGVGRGDCVYLNEEGHSCIAGLALLIADPEIHLVGFSGSIRNKASRLRSMGQDWHQDALCLIQAAQFLHDSAVSAMPQPDLNLLCLFAERRLKMVTEYQFKDTQEIINILEELLKEQS